jgi:hypothetical protein
MKHKPFIFWILLNIVLPFVPFILKIFINYYSLTGKFSLEKIADSSELLIYSITICIIILNINLEESKTGFELALKLFIFGTLILDFVLLGLSYAKHRLINLDSYLFVSVVIPTIVAPFYKFQFKRFDE